MQPRAPVPSPPVPSPAPRRLMSLRAKLTLWMLAIFIVIQLSLALVLQLYQARSIEAFFDERIERRLRDAAQAVRPQLPNVQDSTLAEIARTQIETTTARNHAYHLLRSDGSLLATSYRPGITIHTNDLTRATRDSFIGVLALPGTALGPGAEESAVARSAVAQLRADDGSTYYLVLANNDIFAQQLLSLLTRIVLVSIPIGLVATGVSAYLIAGIAVRPFAAIGAAARQLSPESIGRSVHVPPVSVEVLAVREELERARKRIEQGFAAQERFMSNVSHELKTPIATILTEAQVLRTETLPQEARDFLKSQAEELEKLANMVDSFLLLTRIRHGKAHVPAAANCVLRDVLLDSYASCSPFAKQYGVRVDLQLPDGDDSEASVVGNCDLLRIIFDNIIRNAIRFSPPGSVISIAVRTSDHQLLVSIRDRGTGIPPELLPRIFDRFAQATEEQRRGRGHGLGLEIALGVAELHAGTITVRNCDDVGCEFTVSLPLAGAAPSAAHADGRNPN